MIHMSGKHYRLLMVGLGHCSGPGRPQGELHPSGTEQQSSECFNCQEARGANAAGTPKEPVSICHGAGARPLASLHDMPYSSCPGTVARASSRGAAAQKLKGGETLITLEGVGRTHDGQRQLFSDVTFTLKRGERMAVVGANGSGKTTLLRVIAGETPAPFQLKARTTVSV